jgi:hypothetical protein
MRKEQVRLSSSDNPANKPTAFTGLSLKTDIRFIGQEIYSFSGTEGYTLCLKMFRFSLYLWIGRVKLLSRFFFTYSRRRSSVSYICIL